MGPRLFYLALIWTAILCVLGAFTLFIFSVITSPEGGAYDKACECFPDGDFNKWLDVGLILLFPGIVSGIASIVWATNDELHTPEPLWDPIIKRKAINHE